MYIQRIVLKNVGPHRSFERDLVHGSIGIFGKNGSGKSTITDSAYACLTNTWNRFSGVKGSAINLAAGSKDESFVRCSFSHRNVEFEISRWLQPNRSEMRIAGNVITADKEIERALTDIGIKKRVLDFAVFKPQDGIFDFLSATDSVRAKSYQALTGMEFCADLVLRLTAKMQDPALTAHVVDNLDTLRANLTAIENEILAAEREKKKYEARLLSEANLAKALVIESNSSLYAKLSAQIESSMERLQLLNMQIQNVEEKLFDSRKEALELGYDEEKIRADLSRISAQFAQWENYDRFCFAKKQVQQQVANAVAAVNQFKQEIGMSPSECLEHIGKLEAEVETSRRIIATTKANQLKVQQRLSTLDLDPRGHVCPTCDSKVSVAVLRQVLETQKQENEQAINASTMAATSIKRSIDKLREAFTRAENAETERQRRQKELDTLEARAVPVPDVAVSLLKKQKLDADLMLVRLESVNSALARVERERDSLKDSQRNLAARLQTLVEQKAEIEASDPNSDVTKKIIARLGQHREAELNVSKLAGTLSALSRSWEEAKKSVAWMERTLSMNERRMSLLKVLDTVKQAFKPDALPNIVAQSHLLRMEDGINKALELFNSPFIVKPDENLSFRVKLPGLGFLPADKLSGGMKAVLAVAFWYTVSTLHQSGVGLLVLDEPTGGMDTSNVNYLASAMEHFTSSVRNRRQMIMVTHSQAMRRSFEQVIDLG